MPESVPQGAFPEISDPPSPPVDEEWGTSLRTLFAPTRVSDVPDTPPSPTLPGPISIVVNLAYELIDRRSSPRHRNNLDIQETLYSVRRLSSIASGWYLEEDSVEAADDGHESRDDFEEEQEEDPNDPDAKWRVTV